MNKSEKKRARLAPSVLCFCMALSVCLFCAPSCPGAMVWSNPEGGSWSDSTNWSQYNLGPVYIGGLNDGAKVTHTGDLLLTDLGATSLYVGYDDSVTSSSVGKGVLEVSGKLKATNVCLGLQRKILGTVGAMSNTGTLVVGNGLTVGKVLQMGRDGTASLTVSGGDVVIGDGSAESQICIGMQRLIGRSEDQWSDVPITVDFSGTTNVTIDVEGFYIASRPNTNLSAAEGGHYQFAANVKMGENSTVTASEIVLSSSYGSNLSPNQTTLEFGSGQTVVNTDTFYLGYWKSENAMLSTPVNGMNYEHDEVYFRLSDNGEKTATFTLGGESGDKTNLYIAYQNCDTTNVATGTLDLTNTASATLTLGELRIGYKTEDEVAQGRRGGGEGLLNLGDNTTLTADSIKIAYKSSERIPPVGQKVTQGALIVGENSTVTTGTLELGSKDNRYLVTNSYITMTGGEFTVQNGATFGDNISIDASNGSVFTINRGTAADALNMYADLKIVLEDSQFVIDGGGADGTAAHMEGYNQITVAGDSLFKVIGDSEISRSSYVRVGDTGKYEIHGDMSFKAGDVRMSGTASGGTNIGDSGDTDGQTTFVTTAQGSVYIDGNFSATGQTLFNVNASDGETGSPAFHITGDASFNSTLHEQISLVVNDGVVVGDPTYQNVSGKEIAFWIDKGTCQIDGHTIVTGNVEIVVNGGALKTNDMVFNGSDDETTYARVLVTDGLLKFNDSHRGNVGMGMGMNLTLELVGGTVEANSIGVRTSTDTPLPAARPVATFNFYGGELIVETLGSAVLPYYLDQSVHTYTEGTETLSDLKSVLSPGGEAVGKTTIVGKTFSRDNYHTYNVVDGEIRLDMAIGGRDELIVLGSMNMKNAHFNIQVSGDVPIKRDEKDGYAIDFVTLATAEEFYTLDAAGSFAQLSEGDISPESGIVTFSWTGDDTDWSYYIAKVNGTDFANGTGYELRAYTVSIPEPTSIGLMALGSVVLALLCIRRKK
ncbi:MAG: PEP-CTERM sorting domain-containing protein [Planctomycetia bacterium]|nr:PEP-CTERM sorting domain-containing protein [Planctomycetia bacterium]